MSTIYYMPWDELERGWGARPDGCSLHDTAESYSRFIAAHLARQPKETPNEYDSPGRDKPQLLQCSPALAALVTAKKSLRLGKSLYRVHKGHIEALSTTLLADAAKALAEAERLDMELSTLKPAPARPKPAL